MDIESVLLEQGAKVMKRSDVACLRDFHPSVDLANEPCVLTGMCAGWAALCKWSWDFLAQLEHVFVDVTPDGETYARITVAEFAARVQSGMAGQMYMKDATFHHKEMSEAMGGDYATPACFSNWLKDPELIGKHRLVAPHYPAWSWLYCGPRGSMSPLHVDVLESSAWNVLLSGAKLWIFFPPWISEDSLRDASTGNLVNPFASAVDASLMSRAVVTLQQPGEIVFTPSGWLHAVMNVQNSIALTENFVNASNYLFVLRYLQKELEKERGTDMERQIEAVIRSLTRTVADKLYKE